MMRILGKILENKKIVWVILGFALFVFVVTFSLQKFELSQQKPRVMKGIEKAFIALADERYNMTELFRLLDEGVIAAEGKVNINYLSPSYVNKDIQRYMTGSEISFDIVRDEPKKEMGFELHYSYLGTELLSGTGYLDQDSIFIKIPEIYPETVIINTQNVKQQYESSLIYKFLGKSAPRIEKEFSIDGFPEIEIPKDITFKGHIDGYTEINKEILRQIYNEIQVEKLDYKKELLVEASYRSATAYSVFIPNKEANLLIGSISDYFDLNDYLKNIDEDMKFIVFLDQDKEISSLEMDTTLYLKDEPKRISLNWDFIGKENKFDEVILSIHLKEENYDFGISIKNIFEDSHRNAFFDFKMEKPYQGDLLSIDLDYNIITGESRFVYDINIPEILIGEGNLHLAFLEEEIVYPMEIPVEIFKLDIISLLKLVNDLNLSFFQ